MKLIEAEWGYDGSQVTFHFVADGRVDFRELVRETAASCTRGCRCTRSGRGTRPNSSPASAPAGVPTCCSTFLREFAPVSIRMVKDQSLAMNPSKFTGLCGKLMCCLRYEQDPDDPAKAALPQAGMVVMTPWAGPKWRRPTPCARC